MTIGTVLLIVLILILVGALPAWPHSKAWGYYPSGGLGLFFFGIISSSFVSGLIFCLGVWRMLINFCLAR